MDNKTANVLKAEKVNFEGQVQLDLNKPKQNQPKKQFSPQLHPTRIVEETDEYVVIETGCSCGKKILIKCTYKNN